VGPPRAFYDELGEMLEALRPARLNGSTSKATFDSDAVEVVLRHEDRTDWGIWATVGARDAIVGTHYAHEHFVAPKSGDAEERPWTTQIVDFIASSEAGATQTACQALADEAPPRPRTPPRRDRETRHTVGGEPMAAPAALEIVERDSAYYLLYLDDTGEEMTDTWHSSLDDAKRQAEFEFSVRPDEWPSTDTN
jgi:hypothetical protein